MILGALIIGTCVGYGVACMMFVSGEESRRENYHEYFKKFYGIGSVNQTEQCITKDDEL